MKGKTRKAFAIGLALGLILVTGTAYAASKILSAEYNNVKVIANGQAITLTQPLISVVDEAAPPNSFANYMPVRTVLESLGYTVTYDGTTETINIFKPEPIPVPAVTPAPAPTPSAAPANNSEESAVEVIAADVLVDGEEHSIFTELNAVEITGEEAGLYVKLDEILNGLSTKDTPYNATYNKETNTIEITTKPPFENGVGLRDLLAGLDISIESTENGTGETVLTVNATKGNNALIIYLKDVDGALVGTVEYDGKSADFDYYIAEGSTLIIEESFVQALQGIGLTE